MDTKDNQEGDDSVRFFSLFFILLLTTVSSGQELRDFVPPNRVPAWAAILDVPSEVMLYSQLLYIGPRNARLLGEEIKKAEEALKPGETAKYIVIVRYGGGTIIFQRLERIDVDFLGTPDDKVLAIITLSRPKFGFKVGPIPALSKEAFGEVKKQLGDTPLTYADHCFCIEAINASNGHSIDANDTAKTLRLLGKLELRDLTKEDMNARASADGTVILATVANEPTYRVYIVESGQLDKTAYPKGEFLKSLGNTVWLYTKTDDGCEYVTIYANLDKVNAKPGDKTKRADTVLGQWKSLASPTLNWSVWRVHGPKQRFFREAGGPKPYCILPLSQKST